MEKKRVREREENDILAFMNNAHASENKKTLLL